MDCSGPFHLALGHPPASVREARPAGPLSLAEWVWRLGLGLAGLGGPGVPGELHRVPSEAKAAPQVLPDVVAELELLCVAQAAASEFVEAHASSELPRAALVVQGGCRCVLLEAKAAPRAFSLPVWDAALAFEFPCAAPA
jgi:hypothetical protein